MDKSIPAAKPEDTKRAMISKDSRSVMIATTVAAVILSVSVVLGGSMIEDIAYNGKVIDQLNETNSRLESNKQNASKIEAALNNLNKSESLKQLRVNADDEPLQVIIDAMPTNDRRATFAASLQSKVLNQSGASLQSLNVNDGQSSENTKTTTVPTTSTTMTSTGNGPLPMEFSASLLGDAMVVTNTLKDIERTIRPISITSMTITPASNKTDLTVDINAVTYYNPLLNYAITEEVIPR